MTKWDIDRLLLNPTLALEELNRRTDAEPVAAMTTDYLGCEYVSMDVAGIEKIAAAGSKGPTDVVYLYAAPPALSVAVKALEWHKQAMSHGYGLFIRLARTSIGDYQISHGAAGKYEVYFDKGPISAAYDSEPEAKASAQADYEARIRSALSAQVQDVAEDGRPCTMDAYVGKLFEENTDHFDRDEAINAWLHGEWDIALSYLPEPVRAELTQRIDTNRTA